MVFINKSKIHFESKSQQTFGTENIVTGCLSISQRYILKANHNDKHETQEFNEGVYQ